MLNITPVTPTDIWWRPLTCVDLLTPVGMAGLHISLDIRDARQHGLLTPVDTFWILRYNYYDVIYRLIHLWKPEWYPPSIQLIKNDAEPSAVLKWLRLIKHMVTIAVWTRACFYYFFVLFGMPWCSDAHAASIVFRTANICNPSLGLQLCLNSYALQALRNFCSTTQAFCL